MELRSSSSQHVSDEWLEAFANGTLSFDDSYSVSDHLAYCRQCRLVFADLIRSIGVANDDSLKSPPIDTASGQSKYHQLEPLAQGGMGIIYSAVQEGADRKVVIKCISPSTKDPYSSDRKQRLLREAEALTRIDHPNIVRVQEVVLIQDSPALVMEYVQGEPLQRWIRARRCEPKLAVQLVLQLAQAIEHAHRMGVIHCDLKPHSALVANQAEIPKLKVIDFGLAKLSDQVWEITQSGDVLGTPGYMAPEQTTGKRIPARAAIDVYGLGTIF